MGSENNPNIFSPEQNGANKKRKVVIAGVDIETQARDIAEEKMTVAKGELKGVRGFFKKIWKHNLAHEYYRQKEIAKAKREIKQSGNLYVGEGGDKADHADAMKAIVERFVMEYNADGLLRSGEEKKLLKGKNTKEVKIKSDIQDLIKKFATGSITEDEFKLEKNKFFNTELGSVKGSQGDALARKDSLYADNLLEIAKQIKDDIAHGKGLDALDFDFDVVVGRAKAGVETEAQYNVVDRIVEKFKKTSGGRFVSHFVNEATVASAVSIVYGFGVKGTISAAQKAAKWVGPLGLGLSAGIGGAVAGARENKRLKEDRAQHIREMAKGKEIETGSRRREEMEKFRYETKNANDLTANLYTALTKLQSNPSPEQLNDVLNNINEIDARISFSEREKIDLISFSDAKRVEQEKTRMYIATAEAKVFLKKNAGQEWAASLKDEAGLRDYLSQIKETKIQADFKKEKELKDEIFNKMKRKKVAWAAVKGLGIGVGVGMAFQEIQGTVGSTQEGIFHSGNTHNSDSVRHFTLLEYLRRYVSGDLPKVDAGLPHTITEHINGSEQMVNIGAKDYIKNHENLFSRITRGHWADNNSLRPDKNELKLWWGGEKGTGLNSDGNYVFNVKHMTSEGSSRGNTNWNPRELMKEGRMKLLISLSHDTQNQVVEVPIDASGNAIIDPNSEIGKLAFQNINGHAKFIGKLAEVAVMGENKDGISYVDILATHEGKGIDNITEVIKTAARDIETVIPGKPSDYDVNWPYAVPVAWRNPLEKLRKKTETEMETEKRVEITSEALSDKMPTVPELEKEIEVEREKFDMFENFLVAAEIAALAKEKEMAEKEDTGKKESKEDRENKEKLITLLSALKHSKEQLEKAKENANKKDGPARAAALHTIYKLENSPDLSYEDLNAGTLEEGDRKFLDLTRRLWTELTVHEKPDRDANACLKLMELAGIKLDKIGFVKAGDLAESGITMDTSMRDGVIVEEGGKRLIIDHHGKESDRTTSATKFVYETLLEMGLLQREEYLDRFVDFITKCDNFDFTPDEMRKVYPNYSKNLYGLSYRMKIEDIFELIKGGADPMSVLSDEYLRSHEYFDPRKGGSYKPLVELVKHMESQIRNGKEGVSNLERSGFVVDTGDDRFGKILIDTRKKIDKGRYFNRVDGDNNSNQIEVFLKGYGGYLVWSPGENSFVLYTQRKMDAESISGEFSQGFNVRGHMWMKPQQNPEKLTITIEEIFSKLTGQDFKLEGALSRLLKADEGGKKLLDLLDEGNLTEDVLRKTAIEANVPLRTILSDMMRQRIRIGIEFTKKINEIKKIPLARAKSIDIDKIAIDLFLRYQKGKMTPMPTTPPVAPVQPAIPNQPPAPKSAADTAKEKEERMSDSLKVLKGSFATFELSYDAIKAEAQKSQVSPAELAVQFVQSNPELKSQYDAKKISIDEQDKGAVEKLAVTIIFEDESNRVREKIEKMLQMVVQSELELKIETDSQRKQFLENNIIDIKQEITESRDKESKIGVQLLNFLIAY